MLTPGHYVEPSFAPDEGAVVYRKTTGGYLLSPLWSVEPGIYWVSTNGGDPVKVSSNGSQPQFSSDGSRIMFTSRGENGLELHSVDLNGQDKRMLASGENVTVRVSPDGQWLAFTEHFTVPASCPPDRHRQGVDGQQTGRCDHVHKVSEYAGEFLHWSADGSALWTNRPILSRSLSDAFALFDQGTDEGSDEEPVEAVIPQLNLGFSVPADRPTGTVALVGGDIITMREADTSKEIYLGASLLWG